MRPPLPLLAATLALASASPVAAQASYGPPAPYASSPEGPERQGASERPESGDARDPAQDLVRQLNLRSDQRAAFRDYQSAFTAQGEDPGEGADDVARLAAMTTPQRLDDSARRMDRERADFERIAAATRRFYAGLDPAQRRTFDRLTAPREDDDAGDDGDAAPSPAAPRD